MRRPAGTTSARLDGRDTVDLDQRRQVLWSGGGREVDPRVLLCTGSNWTEISSFMVSSIVHETSTSSSDSVTPSIV